MNYLTLENVNKSFGDKILFENLNLTIAKGQKIALIAKNGSGKTTLLKVIAGEENIEGENAKLLLNKNITRSYLRQDPYFDPESTVIEAALDSDNEEIRAIRNYELALLKADPDSIEKTLSKVEDLKAWDIEARVKEVLGQLNVHNLSQKIGSLSGGQKKRLALAKIIIDDCDFIILDEPTNHLDIEMIEWLEKYLQSAQRTLFMVTHDRYFLERVCNEIVELDNGELNIFRGSYSDYLEKKAAMLENNAVNLDKTKKLYRKELDWIRKQPKARGTKAKSRIDKFYKIKEDAHKTVDSTLMEINLETARLGSKIIELHALNKSFDDLKIVESFDYKFKKGEKVGIAGPNGVGKTTFLKLLTKEIRPDGGKVVIGDTVVFGHYTQDGISLDKDKTVIEAIRDIAEYVPLKKGLKMTAETLLERFLFPRSQQQVFVSQLSGGERRRLHLLRVLMANPNFLILDEPTNDLDILTLNVLEDYLQQFPGCVIIVSHDRYFMDKLVDHLFVLEGKGKVKDFNGTYSEYKASLRQYSSHKEDKPSPKIEEKKVTNSKVRKLHYLEKKELEGLEKDIAKLEKQKSAIEAKFLEGTLTNERMQELSVELGNIKKSIEVKEERWFELSEFA